MKSAEAGLKSYRLMDHTADLGIEVWGKDLGRLFINAARAMFDQMVEGPPAATTHHKSLSVKGLDAPDLMINWLRELLYWFNGRYLLPGEIMLTGVTATRLEAAIALGPFDPRRHTVKTEIKAVTYHQIEVAAQNDGWRARVIFDL